MNVISQRKQAAEARGADVFFMDSLSKGAWDDEGQRAILRKKIDIAKRFTGAYKQHQGDHVAIREAACLGEQYPAVCKEITDYDLIAGRAYYEYLVSFSLEAAALNSDIEILRLDNKPDHLLTDGEKELRARLGVSSGAFSYNYSGLKNLLDAPFISAQEKEEIAGIIRFWYDESTLFKFLKELPEEVRKNLGRVSQVCQYALGFVRVCCISVDFDKLIRLGIPGMKALISDKKEAAVKAGGQTGLYEGMLMALDVLVSTCKHYENECADKAAAETNEKRKHELLVMADTLRKIQIQKPATFREGIQLFWLYNLLTAAVNYGRMDIYLGDLYAGDIDSGNETEESLNAVIKSLWRMIDDLKYEGNFGSRFNTRVILGGKARRNEANADKFAIAALEVTKALKVAEPMVTLRFYEGQNPVLMDKAMACIGAGCVNPTLYNDDVLVPWVSKAYNVSLEEAENYIPEGCGEILIDHKSVGSPNGVINYVTALDYILHNGYNTEVGEQRGLALGELDSFDTFEKLLDAFKKQVDFTHGILAKRHALETKIEAEDAAFLFLSMLTDDCIDRGKSLFDGGARYIGGQIETFGLTNACDSLYAIKALVYDKKVMTLQKMVEILDANFEGYEKEHQMMLNVAKYGNDISEVDDLHTEVSNYVCQSSFNKAKEVGLHFFLNCNLNPGGVRYGESTKASSDGRVYGETMAVGNCPMPGRDKSGITALLNSMSKGDQLNSGYVHNLKVSSEMFAPDNYDKFKSLIDTYFDNGGCQLMVTTLNKGDLENAMKEPEKYSHILVRVGGWTARFVELSKRHQQEILDRTLYS